MSTRSHVRAEPVIDEVGRGIAGMERLLADPGLIPAFLDSAVDDRWVVFVDRPELADVYASLAAGGIMAFSDPRPHHLGGSVRDARVLPRGLCLARVLTRMPMAGLTDALVGMLAEGDDFAAHALARLAGDDR